jgi:hypothetical protein
MPHLAATADRIDYWIRRQVVPCPAEARINPSLDRYIGLTAIGRSLKDQYDALTTRIPPHLAALVRQITTMESEELNPIAL